MACEQSERSDGTELWVEKLRPSTSRLKSQNSKRYTNSILDECYYHRKQKSYRQNTFFNIDQLTRDAVSTVANVIEGK